MIAIQEVSEGGGGGGGGDGLKRGKERGERGALPLRRAENENRIVVRTPL